MLLLSTSEVDMEARDNMGRDLGTMIRYTSVLEIHCCYIVLICLL